MSGYQMSGGLSVRGTNCPGLSSRVRTVWVRTVMEPAMITLAKVLFCEPISFADHVANGGGRLKRDQVLEDVLVYPAARFYHRPPLVGVDDGDGENDARLGLREGGTTDLLPTEQLLQEKGRLLQSRLVFWLHGGRGGAPG